MSHATTSSSTASEAASRLEAEREAHGPDVIVLDHTGYVGHGNTVAACANSTANTTNNPYLPSASNQALYQYRLTYGLPKVNASGVEAVVPKGAEVLLGGDVNTITGRVFAAYLPEKMVRSMLEDEHRRVVGGASAGFSSRAVIRADPARPRSTRPAPPWRPHRPKSAPHWRARRWS